MMYFCGLAIFSLLAGLATLAAGRPELAYPLLAFAVINGLLLLVKARSAR